MKKILALLAMQIVFFIGTAVSAPLPKDGAEYKQLEAMGYTLSLSSDGSLTVADLGDTRIVFKKTDDGFTVFRLFNANKKLSDQQRFEVLEIVNQINSDQGYQVSYAYNDYLTVALYIYGDVDAKTFAKVVRKIEAARFLFDVNPRLLELLL